MRTLLRLFLSVVRDLGRGRADLVLENASLRAQLAAFVAEKRRPALRDAVRTVLVALVDVWPRWRSVLYAVKPDTVVRWHRAGFRYWWRWRSKRGRPKVTREIRDVIRRLAKENPLWGAPRIHGELLKLGFEVSERTISRLLPEPGRRPGSAEARQRWRTFLKNHASEILACDFFTVPSATLRLLFVFAVLDHARRRIVHFNVTDHPTAEWAALQMVEAVPDGSPARYLIRDRDSVYGEWFRRRVQGLGLEEVICAPRTPEQNALVERAIGTLRRDCLDHVIVMNESHLRRIVTEYVAYYSARRTHLSLAKDAPEPRPVDPPANGPCIVAIPHVGGIHHHYKRRAA